MPSEIVSPKTYLKTFTMLLALLALTVGANFVNLGPFNVAAALLISMAKAALILLFFMEVRYSPPIVWLFATAGFLWLLILLILTMADYQSRSLNGLPDWRSETNGVNHVEFEKPSPRP